MKIDDLADKVVLITGASTGIGAAAARAFGAQGARVAVHYNASGDKAEAVAAEVRRAGGQAVLVGGDVTRPDAAAEIVAKTVAALNVTQVVAFVRHAVALMRPQGGGNIINVSSIAARHGGGPGSVLYAAAKGFVSTATHGWAKELAADRIRVNAISPGVILTPFHERFSTPEMLRAMQATVPMNRLGEADECAGAMLFLASAAMSGYVTGQIIEINGGQLMP